jgi:hypothetical protein
MEFNPNRSHSTASNTQVPNKLSPQPSRIEQNAQKPPAPLEHYASTGSKHVAQAGSKPLSDFSVSDKKAEEAAKDPKTDCIRDMLSSFNLGELNDENSFQSAKKEFESFIRDLSQDIPYEDFYSFRKETDSFNADLTRFFRYKTTLNTIQPESIKNEEDLVTLHNKLKILEGAVREPLAKHTFFSSVWEEFKHFRDSMHALQATQEKLKSIESNPPKTIQDIKALAPSLKQLDDDLRSSLAKLEDTSNLRRDFPIEIRSRLQTLSAALETVCDAQELLNTLKDSPHLDPKNLTEFQKKLEMLENYVLCLRMDIQATEPLNEFINLIEKIQEVFKTHLDRMQNPPPQAHTTYIQAAGNDREPVINQQIQSPQENTAVKQFYDNLSGGQLEQLKAIIRQKILPQQGIIPQGCDLENGTLTIKDMAALSAIHTVDPRSYQRIVLEDNDIKELPKTIQNISHVGSLTIGCPNLESLKHIDLCTSLKQLDISNCRNLMNCEPLALCSSIRSLKMRPFTNYKEEPLLSKAELPPQLQHIHLSILLPFLQPYCTLEAFQKVFEVMCNIEILDIDWAHRNFMNWFSEKRQENQTFKQLKALRISNGSAENRNFVKQLLQNAPNLAVAYVNKEYERTDTKEIFNELRQKGILVDNFKEYETKRKEILGL